MKYNLYVFHDDESATIFDEPFSHTDDPTQDELTEEQKIDLAVRCSDCYEEPPAREIVATWSDKKKTAWRWESAGLIFDTVAIVPVEHAHAIEVLSNAMCNMFGDDSSTYAAVEAFNDTLKALSVKVFTIPCIVDGEEY